MEGKKAKSCSPSSLSSAAVVADGSGFHGKGETGRGSPSPSSSGLFNSVFPPPPSVETNGSSHSDIFGPPTKQGYADQTWRANEGNTGKGSKEKTTSYQCDRSDPCFLSNSLYYGGRDIYAGSPNSQSSVSSYTYKKDGKDDSGNGSDFASRGNWWQGSLYY